MCSAESRQPSPPKDQGVATSTRVAKLLETVKKLPRQPIVSQEEVSVQELFGQGGFSAVHAVEVLSNTSSGGSTRLVLKRVRPDRMTENALVDLLQEGLLLSQISHHHIVALEAIYVGENPNDVGLVLERCQESLLERINKWKLLKRRSSRRISFHSRRRKSEAALSAQTLFLEQIHVANDLAAVLEYLHEKRIMFRDLKPENVGFTSDGVLKVFDFGAAVRLDEAVESADHPGCFITDNLVGTHPYCAPELALGGKPYGLSVDVYSWAILTWEILTTKEGENKADDRPPLARSFLLNRL